MQPDTVVERPVTRPTSGKVTGLLLFRMRPVIGIHSIRIGMETKLTTILAVVFSCALGSMALAADPHTSGTKGQPNQDCGTIMVFPGKTMSSPAHSAFNEDSTASAHYANPTTQGGISSGNSHVAAQYDVACFQQMNRTLQQSARMSQRTATMSVGHGHGR